MYALYRSYFLLVLHMERRSNTNCADTGITSTKLRQELPYTRSYTVVTANALAFIAVGMTQFYFVSFPVQFDRLRTLADLREPQRPGMPSG